MGSADRVILFEDGTQQALLIVNELPSWSRSYTMERQKSNVIHSVLLFASRSR
jgi:hypothetical protein